MSARSKRIKLAASAVGMLTATVLALSTAPASASNSYNGLAYVHGSGTFTDDWGDEGITDTTHNTNSNATCLWQEVLWANGYLEWSGVDGIFGSGTATATKNYQHYANLTADGSAGKATWGYAGSGQMYQWQGTTNPGDTLWVDYDGWDPQIHDWTGRSFGMIRNANGDYQFWDRNGNARDAGYNYRTCS